MAMSDCIDCWVTPCECGRDYRHRSTKWLIEQRDMLQRIIDERKDDESKSTA